GEGVPQRVGMHPTPQAAEPSVALERLGHPSGGEAASPPVEEERSRIPRTPLHDRPPDPEVVLQRRPGFATEGDHPLLAALPPDPRRARRGVQVVEVHPAELRAAKAAAVEDLEDGPISEPEG